MGNQRSQLSGDEIPEKRASLPHHGNLPPEADLANSRTLIPSRSASPVPDAPAQSLIPHEPVGSATTQPAAENTPTLRAHILKNWWMEIGACFSIIASLIAIVATLYPHQDRPLPQWPFLVSVNTLISIYVVVLKGAILLVTAEDLGQLKWRWFRNARLLGDIVTYDSASRGPLGALQLLWRLRLRHPLSSCGALISVLVLTVDPFAQQIIRYYDCSVPLAGDQAAVPRTNMFLGGGAHSGAFTETITAPLQAAINAGIFSPGGLAPKCTTGNCSIEQEYGTVGYCSSCKDVTDQLTFSNVSLGKGQFNANVKTSLLDGLTIASHGGPQSTGPNLFAMDDFTARSSSNNVRVVQAVLAKQSWVYDPTTQHLPTGCAIASTNNTWRCKGYGAAICEFAPCVRTYSSEMTAGIFQEKQLSSSDNAVWGESKNGLIRGLVDTKCLSAHENQGLRDAGYQLNPSIRWLPYKLTYDPSRTIPNNASFPESMLANKCLYLLDAMLLDSLWGSYLSQIFNGTVAGRFVEGGCCAFMQGPQALQTI